MTRLKKFLVAATLIAAAMLTAFSLGGGVLLWAVSGLLMVTAMVVLTAGEIAKQPSEKGITLQTLIVTAVLVLMAGAAGVVIIAITNNSADNLEGQNSGLDSRCQPWEIFDPTLDAAGRGGPDGLGGITSSASGCRRVCYIESVPNTTTAAVGNARIVYQDTSASPAKYIDSEGKEVDAGANQWKLKFSRSGAVDTGKDNPDGRPRVEVITGDRKTSDMANKLVGNNQRIEVATNQRYCRVWDDSTDEEIANLRSQ